MALSKSEKFTTVTSVLSVIVAGLSLFIAIQKDNGEVQAKKIRDWQKGFIFSKLLMSSSPLKTDEIIKLYVTEASRSRDVYNLTDKNLSSEELYGILIELLSSNTIKMPDNNTFSVRTDDEATLDRRLAFEMMQFAKAHEYQFLYNEFALEFINHYYKEKNVYISSDKALSVLLIAMQNRLIGLLPVW